MTTARAAGLYSAWMARASSPAAPSRRTIATRLADARRARFVGRAAEQALFARALASDEADFALLWLVGPGGVGKSSLLERFAEMATASGAAPVRVDARHVLATADSFCAAVARELGVDPDADLTRALEAGPRRVLLIDTAEDLGVLETWLRETFLPALPAGALAVVASRCPPDAAWRSDAGWGELLRVVSMRNLAPDECRAYLTARQVDAAHHDALILSTFGHPLALSLVADLAATSDAVDPALAASDPDLVSALLARFSVAAPDAAHRRALHVAAHVRVTDEALLRHAVDDARSGELYDWLASLSFAVVGREGVHLHDLAAHALDAELRRRDPREYLALHTKVREPCVEAVRDATGPAQLRAASDLSWMHRFSPVMGRVIDWSGARALYADALRDPDRADIVDATRRFEGAAAARAVERWLERSPEAFTVVRASAEVPRGFIAVLTFGAADLEDASLREIDPRVAAAFDHVLARAPLRPGERMCVEWWLDYETHMAPGALVSQLSIRDIRTWLGGAGVAWSVYALAAHLDVWEPMMGYLAHERGADVALGDASYRLFSHDWRAQGPRAFLAMMAEREILGAEAGPAPPAERPLVVLSQEAFVDAVRAALKAYTDTDALDASPLMRSRVVTEAPPSPDEPHPLRRALTLALEQLAVAEKDEHLHAAVKVTFFDPARTQEAAAELLGAAFSTYRRHLAAGVERVAGWLWTREVHGW